MAGSKKKPGERSYDQREHGRLVDTGRHISISYSEQLPSNFRVNLMRALDAIKDVPDEGIVKGADYARVLAEAANAVCNVDRLLPRIEGWRCGYTYARGDARSTFSCHAHEAEAEEWLPYWQARIPDTKNWEITYGVCDLMDWRVGGPPPKQYWRPWR
jgi:hypothetical protein